MSQCYLTLIYDTPISNDLFSCIYRRVCCYMLSFAWYRYLYNISNNLIKWLLPVWRRIFLLLHPHHHFLFTLFVFFSFFFFLVVKLFMEIKLKINMFMWMCWQKETATITETTKFLIICSVFVVLSFSVVSIRRFVCFCLCVRIGLKFLSFILSSRTFSKTNECNGKSFT